MQCSFAPQQPRGDGASPWLRNRLHNTALRTHCQPLTARAAGASSYTSAKALAARAAEALAAACSSRPLIYNGSLSTCEPVKMMPLDDALAHVPDAVPRPVIAKIDLEGGECGALE